MKKYGVRRLASILLFTTLAAQLAKGAQAPAPHYRPKARAVVVTIVPAGGFPDFDAALGRLGDFVIITDPAAKG